MSREKTQMQKLEEKVGSLLHQNVELRGVVRGLQMALYSRYLNDHKGQTRNPEACCRNCAYWFGFPGAGNSGECRRSHAKDYASDEDYTLPWRGIASDQWCGDHPDFWMDAPMNEAAAVEQVMEGRT